MPGMTLDQFIDVNRDELILRCRAKVARRTPPPPSRRESDHGVPRLLDQVVKELRHGPSATDEITRSATQHGRRLWLDGFTIGQVVHGYGDVCQSVTELAVELSAPIDADDFRTLNRCLDDAIAGAVTEHSREDVTGDQQSLELRTLAVTALIAFEALLDGNVGVGGSTGGVVHRSLMAIRALADRSSRPTTPSKLAR